MALLNLRNFDRELYRWLKIASAERGMTLKELVEHIIREVKKVNEMEESKEL